MSTSLAPTTTELDAPYSSPDAAPTAWTRTAQEFNDAQIYWLSTVRADGRPHVTPLIALFDDGTAYFTTGPEEQKAKNLLVNPTVVLTTGRNDWNGLDVVVEGRATRVDDQPTLRRVADRYLAKYGEEWRFDVIDGGFQHGHGTAHAFAVAPTKVYAYDRGGEGAATRYRFPNRGRR